MPVKPTKPKSNKARRAAAAATAAAAAGEAPAESDSSDDSDESSSDSSEEDDSEGEEIVLVNLGADALPDGVDRLQPIVAPPSEEEGEGEGGEGLEAGKLGLNRVKEGGKPVIEEMDQ